MALALAGRSRAARAHDGPHEVEVRIADFVFAPARVEIRAGDSIRWVNRDIAPHTATATGGAWDTGSLDQHEAGRIIFEAPGEHPYYCIHHPHMTGRVVVRPKSDR